MTDEDIEICPDLARQRFVASEIGSNSRMVINNPPFFTYLTPPFSIMGEMFVANVIFKNERLQEVRLCFQPNEAKTSWQNWSESRELAYKKEQERLLLSQIGPGNVGPTSYSFGWGTIDSVYSESEGTSEIVIKYK